MGEAAAPQTSQPMAQVQVLVPSPGLSAGQQLSFTAPPSAPGRRPQRMTVTVNSDMAPGSVVTVQYPVREEARRNGRRLPRTSVQVSSEADKSYSSLLWALYGAGCVSLCCFPPLAMVIWLGAACIYCLQGKRKMERMPRSGEAAGTACFTCVVCTMLFAIIACVLIFEIALRKEAGAAAAQFHSHHWHHYFPRGDFEAHKHFVSGCHKHFVAVMRTWRFSQGDGKILIV